MIDPVARAYAALYPRAQPSRHRRQLLHQHAAAVRLQRVHGPRRSQLHLEQPAVRHRLLEQREEDRYNWAQDAMQRRGIINGVAVTRGFDYRANLGVTTGYTAVLSPTLLLDIRGSGARFDEYRDPAAAIDPAALGFASSALQADGGLQVPAVHDVRQLQHDEFELDDRVARIAAVRLGRRVRAADGHLLGAADADEDLAGAHRAPRLRLPPADLEHHQRPVPAPDAISSTAPTRGRTTPRPSTTSPSRGRSSCSACRRPPPAPSRRRGHQSSQFEIASPGKFIQGYHGLFVQDDWQVNESSDGERRSAARDQLRHCGNPRTGTSVRSTS